jgi:hypothetical protein
VSSPRSITRGRKATGRPTEDRGSPQAGAAPRRPAWLGAAFAAGLGTAGVVAFLATGQGEARLAAPPAAAAAAAPDQPAIAALMARIAALEAALGQVGDAARHAEDTAAAAAAQAGQAGRRTQEIERLVAERGPQSDRFLAAALLLQASVTTPRPWQREYQAMVDLAPPGALSRTAAEVLLSHAGRGIPTEAELRERFNTLVPQLVARAPRQGDTLEHTVALVRGGFASVGLAAPPPPSDQEQAIAGVAQQLRRGNLAGAVADAGSLDASLQPLLAGWLAQARARLAVEQAVQETLLRVLAPPANPS